MEKEVRVRDIKILDAKTAGKIAAGEVIERPSGVLKELLENSLDSGASAINIDIEKAGKKLIRVNDNGQGIKEQDLPLALLRHSTSKIENFEDLDSLNTFGFRGEALYSIAAISKLSISSCTPQGKGRMIQAEGGKITVNAPAPSLKGTTVEVRELFFNTPARLKFLKSDAVERSHLLACAEEAAMANPEVTFNVKTDGNKVYALAAQNNDEAGLRNRISKIIGENIAKNLIYIQNKDFGLKAFISPADALTPARDRQFFFINRRPVSCKLLQQALYKAYQPYREKDKHPTAVIFMEMPANEFDVNIHPQKKDIKFIEENAVFNFIYSQLSQALLKKAESQKIEIKTSSQPAENTVPDFTVPAVPSFTPKTQADKPEFANYAFGRQNSAKPSFSGKREAEAFGEFLNMATPKNEPSMQARDFEEPKPYSFQQKENSAKVPVCKTEEKIISELTSAQEQNEPIWFKGPYTYLGQLHQSYLLFENPQGMVIIDQHAAQERIYFEEYLAQIENSSLQVQPLMFPVSISLPASKLEAILGWAGVLEKAGFEISRFSAGTLMINSVPNLLKFKEENIKDFIVSLSDIIGDPTKSDDTLKYKLISTMACKKAIKAGERLEKVQAEALISNMKKCKDALHCPHGRPTLITLEMKEITRKFGR